MNFNSKNSRKKVFLMKPKLEYHLSQRKECVYGTQSRKERRLLCESEFVQIDGWTLILKMIEREVLSYEIKALVSFIPMRRMYLWCPTTKK